MFKRIALLACVTLSNTAVFAQASAEDGEVLRAVVVLERHGVRAPIESETRSSAFNAQPWPAWSVEPGVLTPHGAEALKRMGEFYRQRYSSMLPNPVPPPNQHCFPGVYAQSTDTQRTIASAKAMLSALQPGCEIEIHADLQQDPPQLDRKLLADAINGRMANQPDWFAHAFAASLAELHEVLTACNSGDPHCDTTKPDFRSTMLQNGKLIPRSQRTENSVALGADFAENFLLQYVEGMPLKDVGWGHVPRPTLDQLMEMNTRYHDFILRTPYYAQTAGVQIAQRISAILTDIASHQGMTVINGKQQFPTMERFFLLSAHDANLTWTGGLLGLHWIVSDETLNATPPGSALVFELRCPRNSDPLRNDKTDTCTVRAFFIAQTLDQIRNLTPLTGAEKPSIAPIFIPGCSGRLPRYDCTVKDFSRVVKAAIER